MDYVPLEVIVRHAASEIGKFFAKKAENERSKGNVAVLVEDFTDSLYFMPCDKSGYPNSYMFNYMTFDSVSLSVLKSGDTPVMSTMSVDEVQIYLEEPLIVYRYDYRECPTVFLWKGKKMSKRKIPLEKLNVSELMKLAQQAIKDREGLVIDEAFRNKVYK